jgi:hypothetical protein
VGVRRVGARALGIAAVAAISSAASAVASPNATPRTPVYPVHSGITATVFWIGEPVGNGSSEDNALSAYDDRWQAHYGGFDDYRSVRGFPYFPAFTPHENPFYLDVPYSDFTDSGKPRADRATIPWAHRYAAQLKQSARTEQPFSLMKNRWVKMWRVVAGRMLVCYGQIEDAGPYVYDDTNYVFSHVNSRPASGLAQNAGMDVSPAIRDCLAFSGLNNDENKLSWRFVEAAAVPPGPWRRVVTTRQVFWP